MDRVLLASEWGWPGDEIATVLSSCDDIELTEIKRSVLETSPIDLGAFDVVMTYGPHIGRIMPLLRRLHGLGHRRPRFIWWLNENLPDYDHPWLASLGGRARVLWDPSPDGPLRLLPRPVGDSLTKFGHRYRIYGELLWAQRRGLLDVLAVTSEYRNLQLRKVGIESVHIPMGWGPSNKIGHDMGLARDIPVLWIGSKSAVRNRRQNLLDDMIRDLERRRVAVRCYFSGLVGEERTEVLNRSKILLNLVRHPHDFTGHRLLLGAANKALLASESMVDRIPFVPDRHMISAPRGELADRIVFYLEHEDERRRIVEAAYDLIMNQLTMVRAVQSVFQSLGVELCVPERDSSDRRTRVGAE